MIAPIHRAVKQKPRKLGGLNNETPETKIFVVHLNEGVCSTLSYPVTGGVGSWSRDSSASDGEGKAVWHP